MKTIIITGANGNLGTAVTNKMLNSGYQVIATVINEEAKNSLPEHPNLQREILDLTNETATAVFIQDMVTQHGHIDAALMLAGGFAAGSIAATTGADLERQFALNFETAYYMSRPLFQRMMQQGYGRLVYIGARPALSAADGKNLLAYGLSKSLLFKLAEYLNEEARGNNVTATVVVPSTLDTPLNRQHMPNIDPANWVKPQDLAEVLEFIVSDKGNTLRETVLKVYNNA